MMQTSSKSKLHQEPSQQSDRISTATKTVPNSSHPHKYTSCCSNEAASLHNLSTSHYCRSARRKLPLWHHIPTTMTSAHMQAYSNEHGACGSNETMSSHSTSLKHLLAKVLAGTSSVTSAQMQANSMERLSCSGMKVHM